MSAAVITMRCDKAPRFMECPTDPVGEALYWVDRLRRTRDAAHPECREREVARIKLEWWEGELARLSTPCPIVKILGRPEPEAAPTPSLLAGITRTPELALITALYAELPRKYRGVALAKVMLRAEREPDCQVSQQAGRIAAALALGTGGE